MLCVKGAIVSTTGVYVGFASFARPYVRGDASFLSPVGYFLRHDFSKPLSVFRAGCPCWTKLTRDFVLRGVACTSVNSAVVSRTDVSLGLACVCLRRCVFPFPRWLFSFLCSLRTHSLSFPSPTGVRQGFPGLLCNARLQQSPFRLVLLKFAACV